MVYVNCLLFNVVCPNRLDTNPFESETKSPNATEKRCRSKGHKFLASLRLELWEEVASYRKQCWTCVARVTLVRRSSVVARTSDTLPQFYRLLDKATSDGQWTWSRSLKRKSANQLNRWKKIAKTGKSFRLRESAASGDLIRS